MEAPAFLRLRPLAAGQAAASVRYIRRSDQRDPPRETPPTVPLSPALLATRQLNNLLEKL